MSNNKSQKKQKKAKYGLKLIISIKIKIIAAPKVGKKSFGNDVRKTIRPELCRTKKQCAIFYLELLWKTNSVKNCVFCLRRLNCATTRDRVFGPSK